MLENVAEKINKQSWAVGLAEGDAEIWRQFVGREAELAQLAAFVEPVFAGRYAGIRIVKGEPGIGKSRLVHDFLAIYP